MTRRMADSVTVSNLPEGFDVYGCYDDGLYANEAACRARFPGKPIVVFTVFASDNEGDCLDVEGQDATPAEAPGWVVKRRQAGHPGPLVYCSESIWPAVRSEFQTQNVPEPGYIVAGYPGSPGPAGMYPPPAVGHQWIDRGPYDESVLVDYLPGIDPAPPVPPIGDDVQIALWGTQQHVFRDNTDGSVSHWFYDSAAPQPAWHYEVLHPA
jgi:hypothetical protein